MAHFLNQYFVNINTGVEYPYYNQKSYNGDIDYNGDLDNFTLPADSDYKQEFMILIELERTNTQNHEETTAEALCYRMLEIDKQVKDLGKVDAWYLQEFKIRLDQYFAKKAWQLDNLSELQVLRRQLAKVAVDLYARNKPHDRSR
jgi:hypothetical protein